jgi:hypothetical protein
MPSFMLTYLKLPCLFLISVFLFGPGLLTSFAQLCQMVKGANNLVWCPRNYGLVFTVGSNFFRF